MVKLRENLRKGNFVRINSVREHVDCGSVIYSARNLCCNSLLVARV